MREQGISRDKYKEYVDMIAARIILRDYMENHRDEISGLVSGR